MDTLKTAGNDALHQGNFVSALDFYQRAIAAADPSLEDELATLHSNCSFTHLKLGQPQEDGHWWASTGLCAGPISCDTGHLLQKQLEQVTRGCNNQETAHTNT